MKPKDIKWIKPSGQIETHFGCAVKWIFPKGGIDHSFGINNAIPLRKFGITLSRLSLI